MQKVQVPKGAREPVGHPKMTQGYKKIGKVMANRCSSSPILWKYKSISVVTGLGSKRFQLLKTDTDTDTSDVFDHYQAFPVYSAVR